MSDPLLDRIWPELLGRGIVAPVPPQRLGSGNVDRRIDRPKSVYRVALPQGASAKLTVGTDLDDLVSRTGAWAASFPTLASQPLGHFQFEGCSALLERFFDGISLEEAVRENRIPFANVHEAFEKIIGLLAGSRDASSASAFAAEWQSWSKSIHTLPIWNETEATFLKTQLLPALGERLAHAPPERQWVHGDLIDRNILLGAGNEPCLIDLEYAERTHFFPTEAARFHALSTAAAEQPGLFAGILPEPAPEWQIHFWLTQVSREALGNTPEYTKRWLPHRTATIRSVGEIVFGSALNGWPWHSTGADARPDRETAQLFWEGDGGWSETKSVRLPYRRDRPQTLFFPLPRQTSEWLRLDPAASSTPVALRGIAFHSDEHIPAAEYPDARLHGLGIIPIAETDLQFVPRGLTISSASGDPQIAVPVRSDLVGSSWLEVQLDSASTIDPSFPVDHRLEECRWVTQPSPVSIVITGWCVAEDDSRISRIEVESEGKILGTSQMTERPDVQGHHAGSPNALHSGFRLDLNICRPLAFIELFAVAADGRRSAFHVTQAGEIPHLGPMLGNYPTWAKVYDPDPRPSPSLPKLKFSILLPVFEPPEKFLRECVASVRQQHYANWELCIVDDASPSDSITAILKSEAEGDERIRINRLAVNAGIAGATNAALAMASGDYIVMLDHDDLLRPHALTELSRAISEDPEIDALYSDEDKITSDGTRAIPFLKPAFSPEYLLAVMYPGHALCVRTSLARKIGGFDSAYDGIQDYEFFLRVSEHTRKITHVPRILYHWRQSPKSSALEGNVKGDMDRKQIAAVRAHLGRLQDAREVTSLGRHRLKISAPAGYAPHVAILLAWPRQPTGAVECDWSKLLVSPATFYALPSITLPDSANQSVRMISGDLSEALEELGKHHSSEIIIVFTQPPLELSLRWLEELSSLAALPDSGCVAPLLLSPEGPVFESGQTLTGSGSRALMRGFDASRDGYNGTLVCNREVAAISPFCVALRRELLPTGAISGANDWTRLCVNLRARGLFNRICAQVRVTVPLSWRLPIASSAELGEDAIDPFLNPHFDREAANFSLSEPPAHLPQPAASFIWHLEKKPGPVIPDACLTLRGWCFRSDAQRVTINVEAGGISWSVACHQHRPDVAKLHRGLAGEHSGFTIDLRLPTGRHHLTVLAIDGAGSTENILRQPIYVPRSAALRRWVNPASRKRAAFQFMAAPSTTVRAIKPEKFPTPTVAPERWPRITIVTPSYQQARFLRETLRSVTGQKLPNVDYHVQDGSSTDGSMELIREHASDLASWESSRDAGQADAIMRGFSKSHGQPHDVMAWLNSDDFYLPGALAFVADYFSTHPEVDVLYGNRIVVDEQSREIGRWFLPPHDDEVLKLNDFIPQETMFWRRRIWDQVGGIDPSLKFAMDWDLLLRFQSAGAKIARVPYFLGCFRVHPAQKTSAQMESIGQKEIDALRVRSFGRVLPAVEIETHPRLLKYVRKSALIEFLWRRLGIRHR